MDPEVRGRVKNFHLYVTLAGGCILIGGSLAAAYMIFSGQQGIPAWLTALAKIFSRASGRH